MATVIDTWESNPSTGASRAPHTVGDDGVTMSL